MPRAQKRLYHVGLCKAELGDAKVALLPGDPARSEKIASYISGLDGRSFKRLAQNREFSTCLAFLGQTPVAITSTGIGGPSAAIAVDELAQLGITTFIRVGTSGALQEFIKPGHCVITTGSVRLDGASRHYAPIEYPAVADYSVVSALTEGAKRAGVRAHVGISVSSDTFYPGEERSDSYRKYILRGLRGSSEEWKELNVLNVEMESATILTLTASMGLRGGAITGVVNRARGAISKGSLATGELSAIKAAVEALRHL